MSVSRLISLAHGCPVVPSFAKNQLTICVGLFLGFTLVPFIGPDKCHVSTVRMSHRIISLS